MESNSNALISKVLKRWWMAAVVLSITFLFQVNAQALTVQVVNDKGSPITTGFRWLLEEDNSYHAVPGVNTPNAPYSTAANAKNPSYTLGVNIHKSHAPTVCSGDTKTSSHVTIGAGNCPGYTPTKRYIVSVLPWHTSAPGTAPNAQTGYTMSGRDVDIRQSSVKIVVHNFPVPTAQITCLVFEDNQPINGAYDQTAEHGLGNFELILNDPTGKVMQDAWTNPVGTTYKYAYTCTAPACIGPNVPADASGNPLSPEQQPVYQRDPVSGLPIVDFLGDGTLTTCPGGTDTSTYTAYQRANCIDPYTLTPMAAGEAVVRYLSMNKYTIEPVPPVSGVQCGSSGNSTSNCSDMVLTATLEGTRGNDAWVRAGEPRYNITLGQLNWLVFYGFVHSPMNTLASGGTTSTITGKVVYAHDQHPPFSPGLSPGPPVPNAYVGLNNLNGNDEQVYTAPCDPATGAFSIPGVPPGSYQLVMWDKPINAIIDFRTITVPTDGTAVDLGPVSVYGWFGTFTGKVFMDTDGNGFPNTGEAGIPNIPVNMRYTDGSLYGTSLTGADGSYTFPQYFTWWRFLVHEVDTTRFKTTGMTAVVDDGGDLINASTYDGTGESYAAMGINPQIQPGGLPYRTEAGDVYTEAVQLFQDMTSRIDWGKAAYGPDENGGIRGTVNYATTRTEEDPKTSKIDPWEPAVPKVTLKLYKAVNDTSPVTNPNFALNGGWRPDGNAIQITTSDSWDDNHPTGCVGDNALWPIPEIVNGFAIPSCAETMRNWDQIRPGVFDGAYRFDSYCPNGNPNPNNPGQCLAGNPVSPILPGNYIVQVVPPKGYEVLKWGDRNIEFGDPKIPFLVEPPPCVGNPYNIPEFHTLFPDQQVPTDTTLTYGVPWSPGMKAPLCDMKYIALNPGANAGVDFNIFTWVPKASRIWGAVWNDLLLNFDPATPNASGNFGVPWLPVAIKDYNGVEVARFYTDQWGHFDGLVPANYDIAPPIPLGLVLAMYTINPNDPGPIDPSTGLACNPAVTPARTRCITDPHFNQTYSQEVIRENWEFYAGKTTFIDTIVIPVSAFQGNEIPLNCSYTDHTPEIKQVSNVIIPQAPKTFRITITAVGNITVPNPNGTTPATVTWDHGFGTTKGIVTVGGTAVTTSWSAGSISATIPTGTLGQLVVTRGDNGLSTTVGVTLHGDNVPVITVTPPAANCQGLACSAIQPAIDSAPNGAIILLKPGSYQENVNLWKPVTLQGYGARVTILDGTAALGNFALKDKQFNQLQTLIGTGAIGLVPNQASDFTLEQGAGILVAGCDFTTVGSCTTPNNNFSTGHAQIDGLTITGATEAGGGILVNGFAPNLKITNNEINFNQGSIGGGIRFGEPALAGTGNPNGSSFNQNPLIDHNRIAQNGSLFSGGGGIAIYGGTDNYQVTNNMICGNLSTVYGGGIGHFGLSTNGLIAFNKVVSNESVDEGGGVHIGGEPPAAATGLTMGSGSVVVNANLIQGNKGGDDGGGFRTLKVNGLDVANNPTNPSNWYEIDVFNNMIVNNSSADHGGGMSFDDTVRLNVVGNTVANNDSTATGSGAFGGPCTENSPLGQTCPAAEAIGGLTTSIPQVAGIASFAHSSALLTALQATAYCIANSTNVQCSVFSNPTLVDNIIWHNRSFYWDATANNNLGGLLPKPGTPYWDLAVYDTPQLMSPTYSILTDGIGANTAVPPNLIGTDPLFLSQYFNDYLATSKGAALGNFVVATFTPNGIQGNYHIQTTSPAVGAGIASPLLTTDYDGDSRLGGPVDIGADQIAPSPFSLTVSLSDLNFDPQPIHTTSAAQQIIVTNNTGAAINISRTIRGTGAAMFHTLIGAVAWTTGTRPVPANGSLTIDVTFAPTTVGNKSATLTIRATGKPSIPISLTGTGI